MNNAIEINTFLIACIISSMTVGIVVWLAVREHWKTLYDATWRDYRHTEERWLKGAERITSLKEENEKQRQQILDIRLRLREMVDTLADKEPQ